MCEENSGVGAARVLFVGVVGSMENGPILGVRIVRVCRCSCVRQVFGREVHGNCGRLWAFMGG